MKTNKRSTYSLLHPNPFSRAALSLGAALLLFGCPKPPPESNPTQPPTTGPIKLPETPKATSFSLVGNLFSPNNKPTLATQTLKDALANEKASFTVLLGDSLSNQKGSEGEIFAQSLFVDLPGQLYAVLGEQEYGTHSLKNLSFFERLFWINRRDLPTPFPEYATTTEQALLVRPDPLGRWYAIRAGVVLVLVLDTEATDEEGFQDQLTYAKQMLTLADEPRTGVNIRHIFVVMHRSPFSGYSKEDARVRDTLGALLVASPKVKAIFSAHSSTYERFITERTRDGAPLADILFGVIGSGGAPTVEAVKKGFTIDTSYGSTGKQDGLIRLKSTEVFTDPTNGPPGAKKPIYGYGLINVSAEGNIEYRFVPVAVEGAPAWKTDSCTFGNGLLRWECSK